MLTVITLAVWTGCQNQARQTVTQPADQPEAPESSIRPQRASQPPPSPTASFQRAAEDKPDVSQPTKADATADTAKPKPEARQCRRPKRPVDSWVIFREAFDPSQDAACTAEWTGGNRLEVHTENIKRITLDMRKLPEGAPKKGPWNLQIDGQGIEMTGFKPKPGYTGRIRDLVRSQNGNWTVHRKALYRIRG